MEYQSLPEPRRASTARLRPHRRFAALLLGAALVGGILSAAPPSFSPLPTSLPAANAIENHHGPGVNWGNGVHIYGAGAFIINGKFVYCVEPWVRSGTSLPSFVSTEAIPGNSSDGVSVATTSGAPLRQITYLLTRYGQTHDNVQAAAVALAIWEIRGAEGRGNAGYAAEISKVHQSVGPAVVSFAQQLRDEAAAWTTSISAGASTDTPGISVDAQQPYRGTVTVPVGTLTLSIENGVFSDGSTTRTWGGAGAPLATSLTWQGQPPQSGGWDRYYRVSFSGSYLEVPPVVEWGDGNGSQSTVSNEEPKVKPLQTGYADIDTTWAPVVSSIVTSKFVSVGEQHSDDVIFAAAPASPGLSGTWRWRMAAGGREWMPIKARVTAYGPYLTDPALNPSPEAPEGAPVAATSSFTTDVTRDHSTPQRYSFVFNEPILEQGYYTYKWDIDANDQDPAITGEDCLQPNAEAGCRVLPRNYFYSDGFGTAGETQVGKMDQGFSTKLSTHEIGITDSFTDTITLPEMQNWLRDDAGNRMPLTLTGTAYLATGVELAQSVEVAPDAVALATVRVTSDPGQNGQQLVSEPIRVPVATSREFTHVTMRWCIVDEDQEPRARGFWTERCDDFGVPEESARIAHPQVRTEANPSALTEAPITDTAIVNGRVPEGSELVFELFKKPAVGDPKRDAQGEPTESAWTQADIDALAGAPLCTEQNRVARTEAVQVAAGLGEDARYTSPEVRVADAGTYWWIESLTHRDDESGEETVLLAGLCGLANETTMVTEPQTPEAPKPTPSLAVTGSNEDRTVLGFGALGAAALLMVCGAAVMLHRRRENRTKRPLAAKKLRECDG